MTTLDYERADQYEDGAHAYGEAQALLDRAHDVQVKLATLLDYALSATQAQSPEACSSLTSDARGIARQVADMVGGLGMTDDTQLLQVLQSVSDYLYKSGIGDGSTAVQDIVQRYERMKAEWIDPQRIVDIAKRYTDYNRPGKVEIIFVDGDQDVVKCWSVYKGTRRDPMWFDGHTLDSALKGSGGVNVTVEMTAPELVVWTMRDMRNQWMTGRDVADMTATITANHAGRILTSLYHAGVLDRELMEGTGRYRYRWLGAGPGGVR